MHSCSSLHRAYRASPHNLLPAWRPLLSFIMTNQPFKVSAWQTVVEDNGVDPRRRYADCCDFLNLARFGANRLDMRLVLQQIQIRQLWKQQLRKQRQNLHECRQCR